MKNTITLIVSLLLILTVALGYLFQRMLKDPRPPVPPVSSVEKTIKGIDISHHQGVIDWEKIDTTKFKFVIIKATEGDSSEDSDTLFKSNWDKSLEKKLIVGAYHIFTLGSVGMKQFKNHISVVPKLNNSMPPLIDVLSLSEVKDTAKAINELRILEEQLHQYYGKKPIIYCHEDYYNKYIANNFKNNKVWIQNYSEKIPSIFKTKKGIWQYSDSGKYDGINGNVDMDYFNGDISSFNEFIGNH
jgi:lysozyme